MNINPSMTATSLHSKPRMFTEDEKVLRQAQNWIYTDLRAAPNPEIIAKELIDALKVHQQKLYHPTEYVEFQPVNRLTKLPHDQVWCGEGIQKVRTYLASTLCEVATQTEAMKEETFDGYLKWIEKFNSRGGRTLETWCATRDGSYRVREAFFLYPLVRYCNAMVAGGWLASVAAHEHIHIPFQPEGDVDLYFQTREDMEAAMTALVRLIKVLPTKEPGPTVQGPRALDNTEFFIHFTTVTAFAVTASVVSRGKEVHFQFILSDYETHEETIERFDHHAVMAGWTKDGFIFSPLFDQAATTKTFMVNKVPSTLPRRFLQRMEKYCRKGYSMNEKTTRQVLDYYVNHVTQEVLTAEGDIIGQIYGRPTSSITFARDVCTNYLATVSAMSDQKGKDEAEVLFYAVGYSPEQMGRAMHDFRVAIFNRSRVTSSRIKDTIAGKDLWNVVFGDSRVVSHYPQFNQ